MHTPKYNPQRPEMQRQEKFFPDKLVFLYRYAPQNILKKVLNMHSFHYKTVICQPENRNFNSDDS